MITINYASDPDEVHTLTDEAPMVANGLDVLLRNLVTFPLELMHS